MKRDPLLYLVIGALIGGVVVWFLANNAVNTNNMGMMQNSQTIDAHFIEQMIPHHEDAIVMAELALTKATRPEVKTLAQNIIDSQSKEIEQMKALYKDWYEWDLPTDSEVMEEHGMMGRSGMHMGMMGDETDIARLENAIDFDRAFVEEMIPHHQMAVMMASMLKNGTNRPEMQKLAGDIITTQTKEINEMRSWYQSW